MDLESQFTVSLQHELTHPSIVCFFSLTLNESLCFTLDSLYSSHYCKGANHGSFASFTVWNVSDGYCLELYWNSPCCWVSTYLLSFSRKENSVLDIRDHFKRQVFDMFRYGRYDHSEWCTHEGTLCTWNVFRRNMDPTNPDLELDTGMYSFSSKDFHITYDHQADVYRALHGIRTKAQ